MAGKQAVKKDEPQVPVVQEAQLPVAAGQIDFGADAGAGLEGADLDSFAIPFLAVLQPLSPVIVEALVEGAKAGMLMNTVTQALYERPRIVPCAFQRRWVRWASRETGGGFKGEFTPAEVNLLREQGKVKELDGRLYFPEQDGSIHPQRSDRLSDTRNHYVLIVEGTASDFGVAAVLALTSTGIKVSKNFLSRIENKKISVNGRMLPAPSFSTVYEMSTALKSNEKGKWYQGDIQPVGDVANASLYAQAKDFYAKITAGKIKVDHESREKAEGGAVGGGAGGPGGDDIPF